MLKLEKQHKILGVNLKNQRGPKKMMEDDRCQKSVPFSEKGKEIFWS